MLITVIVLGCPVLVALPWYSAQVAFRPETRKQLNVKTLACDWQNISIRLLLILLLTTVVRKNPKRN